MPRQAWSPKRERQYEHVKESEKERGRSEETAERIAAATVNQTRTAKGERKRPKSPAERAEARRDMARVGTSGGKAATGGSRGRRKGKNPGRLRDAASGASMDRRGARLTL